MRRQDYSISTLAADQRGFTLTELMVAMLMAAIFVSASIGIVNHSSRVYRAQERVSETQQDVRAALDLMVHDIRMAMYDPRKDTNPNGRVAGILEATATRFRFTMDVDASRAIEANANEDIGFEFDAINNELVMLNDGANPMPLIENVTAMTFTYMDSDGNVLPDPAPAASIQRVVINVQCQNADAQQGEVFNRTLTTDINPRNNNF